MFKHVRTPSPAMVVALIALFVSLGGTALAAVIITNNNQVGPGTIAGARAAAGKNKNVIAGSLGTPDLANAAVTGAKVANGTLTGAKLNEATLATNAKTLSITFGPFGSGRLTLAKAGPYVFKAECLDNGTNTILNFYVNGPGGFAKGVVTEYRYDGTTAFKDAFPVDRSVPPNSDTPLTQTAATNGYDDIGGSIMIGTGTAVVQLALFMHTERQKCQVYGTATLGS
jgi:hypothetical protein